MRALILKTILLITLLFTTVAQAQMDERAAKAAYIYNFLRLTEWPTRLNQPFHLCILGHTPLDEQLYTLEGKQVREDISIEVSHVSMGEELKNCNAIYFDGSKQKQIDVVLSHLHGTPILTISDAAGLADRGVMIELNTLSKRLAFEVNLVAARNVEMDFSARLLKLARFVTTQ